MNNHIIKYLIGLTIVVISIRPIVAQNSLEGEISISGAFALYPITVKWADEFRKIHPDVRIDISAGGAGKGISDALNEMVDLGMVSREIYPEELGKGAFTISVTKDAVVPIISNNNPLLNSILIIGIKQSVANDIWITGKYKTWAQAFGLKSTLPLHIYSRSDACGAAEMWAKYLGKKQEDLNGVGVFGDPGLAQAVKRDALGIGFNNIGYAYDATTKKQTKGIKVLPIDLNNNGKIDVDENFYESLNDLINAIATNKYPSPPARELYFVSKGKPKNKAVVEFVNWVLTDGQKFVNEAGYITLSKEKLIIERNKLK
ncbi:MAG: PstS family phosphate ABC transporter substrate-binding protein [Bacteroidales bacterium]|nr:MAG: PstS family phosphate ABC transporter substrate-binding protein [Bacteroidales bacterium]